MMSHQNPIRCRALAARLIGAFGRDDSRSWRAFAAIPSTAIACSGFMVRKEALPNADPASPNDRGSAFPEPVSFLSAPDMTVAGNAHMSTLEAIHGVLYVSRARSDSPEAMETILDAIASASHVRNKAAGLTGVLIETGGVFLQALEGPHDKVTETFERIAADRRHSRIRVLKSQPIRARLFGEWAMCARSLCREDAHMRDILAMPDRLDIDHIKPARRCGF